MMKTGVKTNTSDIRSQGNSKAEELHENVEVSIGLRTNLYGPAVTSFGGGQNGTGVPRTRMKYEIEKSVRDNPSMMRQIPATGPHE